MYIERTQIERWYNIDKKKKKEVARLLSKSERTIRMEIKRGLTNSLIHDWKEICVYSVDIAEEKYQYNLKTKGPELKKGNDNQLVEYMENGIKKKESPQKY